VASATLESSHRRHCGLASNRMNLTTQGEACLFYESGARLTKWFQLSTIRTFDTGKALLNFCICTVNLCNEGNAQGHVPPKLSCSFYKYMHIVTFCLQKVVLCYRYMHDCSTLLNSQSISRWFRRRSFLRMLLPVRRVPLRLSNPAVGGQSIAR
jgi:hypothetical protein